MTVTFRKPDVSQVDFNIKCLIPDLPEPMELMPYLTEMAQNRWYSNFGPLSSRFEHEMVEFLKPFSNDKLYTVCVSSNTTGLETLLRISDLPPGARILVPAVTFPATALVVINAGFEPVICDVDPASWDLTADIATHVLQDVDFDAVMPVAVFGYPVDVEAWQQFQVATGKKVILDVAASLGQQPLVGALPSVFSLHATKPFGVGEGGLFVTGDEALAVRMRRQINFGFEGGHIVEPGSNAKMAEYFAAVGLAQLARWDSVKEKRRRIFDLYRDCFSGTSVGFRPAGVGDIPSTLMVDSGGCARQIEETLTSKGIQTRQWYFPPLHHHPGFAECAVASNNGFPVAESLYNSLVGLPFHAFLSDSDIKHVCDIVLKYI